MEMQAMREKRQELSNATRELLDNTPPDKWKPSHQAKYDGNMAEIERIDSEIAAEQRRLDNMARGMLTGKATPTETGWRDQEGKPVNVYTPGEKFTDRARDNVDPDMQCGFGEFVAALATGPKNSRVRAALESSDLASGGATVPEWLMPQFIDALRARTRVIQAGGLTVDLPGGEVHMAKVETDPTAGWRLENAAVNEADPTFGRVTFKPKSLAVLVKAPVELLQDSANVEQALLAAFTGAMAVSVDQAALVGTGTNPEPLGIWGTTGVHEIASGPLDYDAILDGWEDIATADADDPSAVILHPAASRKLKGLKDNEGRYLTPPASLSELPILHTSSMGTDQLLMGDWSQLMIGMRQQLRIELLSQRFADNLQVGFLAHLRMDVAVRQAKAFARMTINEPA